MSLGIMLVQLNSVRQPPNTEPLAIEVLAGAALARRPQARVRLRSVGDRPDLVSIDGLIEELRRDRVTLLGISVPQGCLSLAMSLAARISAQRQAFGDMRVVWGHALPTYMPEVFREALNGSSVVRGWGEAGWLEMAIPAIDTENACPNRELGLEPEPLEPGPRKVLRHSAPMRLPTAGQLPRLEASRGCSYGRCSFCTRPPGPRQAWDAMPVDLVLEGVAALVDAGHHFFTFTDEDFFGTDHDRLWRLAAGLKEWPDIEWSASLRAVDILDERGLTCSPGRHSLLESLRSAGLRRVFLGVESLSASQLRRYAKGVTAKGNIAAVSLLRDSLHMDVEIGFMPFDSLVTLEELRESLSLLIESGMSDLVCNPVGRARVQLGSDMSSDARILALAYGFDAETMSYLCHFRDARVESIYRRAYVDWGRALPEYIALRSEDRASVSGTPKGRRSALQARRSAAVHRILSDVERVLEIDASPKHSFG